MFLCIMSEFVAILHLPLAGLPEGKRSPDATERPPHLLTLTREASPTNSRWDIRRLAMVFFALETFASETLDCSNNDGSKRFLHNAQGHVRHRR